MPQNIFQIWKDLGEQVPLAVRRANWSDAFYTVVETVTIKRWPYGIATGYPTQNGVPNDHYEYDAGWRRARIIPSAGSYQWTLVSKVGFAENWQPPTISVDKKAKLLALTELMPMGKYKGLRIENVLTQDVSYIRWIIEKVGTIVFDPSVFDATDSAGKPLFDSSLRERASIRYHVFVGSELSKT